MPVCRYVEENSSATMLVSKRLAGVTPVVNLSECITCMPSSSGNKATHSGFETQRRLHQKSKTGVSVSPKWACVQQKKWKNNVKGYSGLD